MLIESKALKRESKGRRRRGRRRGGEEEGICSLYFGLNV